MPPLIWRTSKRPGAKKDPGMSIQFFELVLSSVTTTILKTFDCATFRGSGQHLKAQLTLQCNSAEPAAKEYGNAGVDHDLMYRSGCHRSCFVLGRNRKTIEMSWARSRRGRRVALLVVRPSAADAPEAIDDARRVARTSIRSTSSRARAQREPHGSCGCSSVRAVRFSRVVVRPSRNRNTAARRRFSCSSRDSP